MAGVFTANCEHGRDEVRLRTLSNGSTAIVRQCLDCGAQVGPALPKDKAPGNLAAFDPSIAERHEQARRKLREQSSREWWADYEAYLRSPEWQTKRAKVLRRDGGKCQACLERPATTVHHRSYRHVQNEPLFDLIAVCAPCHDAIHGRQR